MVLNVRNRFPVPGPLRLEKMTLTLKLIQELISWPLLVSSVIFLSFDPKREAASQRRLRTRLQNRNWSEAGPEGAGKGGASFYFLIATLGLVIGTRGLSVLGRRRLVERSVCVPFLFLISFGGSSLRSSPPLSFSHMLTPEVIEVPNEVSGQWIHLADLFVTKILFPSLSTEFLSFLCPSVTNHWLNHQGSRITPNRIAMTIQHHKLLWLKALIEKEYLPGRRSQRIDSNIHDLSFVGEVGRPEGVYYFIFIYFISKGLLIGNKIANEMKIK